MRLFVGVWLSEAMRKEVIEYIGRIRNDSSGFKWTGPENLHFTLKFLGEIPEVRLKELTLALKSAAARNQNFILKLGSTGFFPPRGNSRIVWVGVSDGSGELVKLADGVEHCCLEHGFTKADKMFQPHLTIARAKGDFPAVKLLQNKFISETGVSGFALIKSHLLPTGPEYQTLEIFPLLV
jgi:2''-5'' RNA ligase